MIIRVSLCIHSSIFCMLPSNGNLHKGLPSFFFIFVCAFLFQFTLSSSVSIPLKRYQCTKEFIFGGFTKSFNSTLYSPPFQSQVTGTKPRWSKPLVPVCASQILRCDGYPGIMLNHARLHAKSRAASPTIQASFTSLHPITWPNTMMFHCFTAPSSKLPSGTFSPHIFHTLLS